METGDQRGDLSRERGGGAWILLLRVGHIEVGDWIRLPRVVRKLPERGGRGSDHPRGGDTDLSRNWADARLLPRAPVAR